MKTALLSLLVASLLLLGCTATDNELPTISPTAKPLTATVTSSATPAPSTGGGLEVGASVAVSIGASATPTPEPTAAPTGTANSGTALPSKPWPVGVSSVLEITASGKPYECVNLRSNPAVSGGSETRFFFQIKGDKARKFARVEGYSEEVITMTTYYEGGSTTTYTNGEGNGCKWNKSTSGAAANLAVALSDEVTVDSYNCALASFYDTAITAPMEGSTCNA